MSVAVKSRQCRWYPVRSPRSFLKLKCCRSWGHRRPKLLRLWCPTVHVAGFWDLFFGRFMILDLIYCAFFLHSIFGVEQGAKHNSNQVGYRSWHLRERTRRATRTSECSQWWGRDHVDLWWERISTATCWSLLVLLGLWLGQRRLDAVLPTIQWLEQAALQNETRRVHVFGKPWDMAAEGYTTEYFTPAGGAFRFVKQKCSKSGPKAFPWFTEFCCFTYSSLQTCGVMYNCGCRVALSKFGQVSSCNIYWPDQPLEHKCPWCTCPGVVCIFVASDTKAFRGVTLLDMLPDGFVVTVLTVLVLHFLFKKIDQCLRPRNFGDSFIAAVKTAIAVSWFVVYCLAFGALFFAGNTSYPHFLGYSRV